MPSTVDIDKTTEAVNTYRFGPILIERRRDGYGRLSIEGDLVNVWIWPTRSSSEPGQSIAEEIAKALALIDGRFEVRRYR